MRRTALNKFWKKHTTKQQLNYYLPPISQMIPVKRSRHDGHSSYELLSNVLQWTPTHGHSTLNRPAKNLNTWECVDIGCRLEEMPSAIDHRGGWRERVIGICAIFIPWWWWWWWWFVLIRKLDQIKFFMFSFWIRSSLVFHTISFLSLTNLRRNSISCIKWANAH